MFVFVVIGVGQTTHRIDEYRVCVQRRRNSKVVGSRCCCCCCANIETGLESFWNVDFVRRVWLVVHWGEPCFIAMTGRMLLVLHLIATAFKNPSSFSIFLYTQRRKCVCQKKLYYTQEESQIYNRHCGNGTERLQFYSLAADQGICDFDKPKTGEMFLLFPYCTHLLGTDELSEC